MIKIKELNYRMIKIKESPLFFWSTIKESIHEIFMFIAVVKAESRK